MARIEEEVDLSPRLSSELIDRPRRDGRLPQALDLLRFLALARLAQLASEPVTLGDERGRFERVEAVELLLEVVYRASRLVDGPSLPELGARWGTTFHLSMSASGGSITFDKPRPEPANALPAAADRDPRDRMRRCLLLVYTLALLVAAAPGIAAAAPAHTKRQAEVNVLQFVEQWGPNRLPGLIDPRTHLLANNTQSICHGRGRRRAGNRFKRFVCVVRPQIHTARQGLYVSYRALSKGRFRIRWLAYRRR